MQASNRIFRPVEQIHSDGPEVEVYASTAVIRDFGDPVVHGARLSSLVTQLGYFPEQVGINLVSVHTPNVVLMPESLQIGTRILEKNSELEASHKRVFKINVWSEKQRGQNIHVNVANRLFYLACKYRALGGIDDGYTGHFGDTNRLKKIAPSLGGAILAGSFTAEQHSMLAKGLTIGFCGSAAVRDVMYKRGRKIEILERVAKGKAILEVNDHSDAIKFAGPR